MSQLAKIDKDYLKWISEIKSKIRSTQIRAALSANAVLIEFYYDLGKMIAEKQAQSAWGNKIIQQLSKDLQAEFPEMKGLSFTNLTYCKMFYSYFQLPEKPIAVIYPQTVDKLQCVESQKNAIYPQPVDKFIPQVVAELSPSALEKLRELIFNTPWGHLREIISKIKDFETAFFYLNETQKNAWSRDMLALQIKSRLHERQGKAITNFSLTLPEPMSDLAQQKSLNQNFQNYRINKMIA